MRRWQMSLAPLLALLLLGVVFALVVVTAEGTLPPLSGAAPQPAERARPAAAPQAVTETVYMPAVADNADSDYLTPFGYATYSDVSDALGLQHMKTAGSRWVTTLLFWEALEPNPPVGNVHTYNWAPYDAVALRAKNAGVNMFVLFTGNPPWAAQYDGGPVTNTAHLVNFVTVMAERYDGDGVADAPESPIINYWSFYAEPDNGDPGRAQTQGKGYWGNNPNGYAAMLAQISPAIHAANPHAKVLIGGLAYDNFTSTGGPFVESFLPNVLARLNSHHGGVSRYLDALAFHFYLINVQRWPTIRHKALEIQGIMNAHGAGHLPLIVPEMAFWSGAAQNSTETMQAQRLVQIYVRGLSVRIRMLAWFSVFDTGLESHGLFKNGSLLEPKLSYGAYMVMTEELTPYRYLQPFSAPGVEGYVFRRTAADRKTVLWATTAPASVDFTQECVRRRDLLGNVQIITDGGAGDGDGANNGKVRIALATNNPTYVGNCP